MITRFPRPPVLAGLEYDRPAVIEASAGTGKTYTIEHLVVDLLIRTEATLQEILVVTFTEKATLELRRRIRRLIEKVLAEATEFQSDLDVAELDQADDNLWHLNQSTRQKLESEYFQFDQAPIYTIHGFCNRLLRELAFDTGQALNPQNIDSDTAFNEAWQRCLRRQFASEEPYLTELSNWLQSGKTVAELRNVLASAYRASYLEISVETSALVSKELFSLRAEERWRTICQLWQQNHSSEEAINELQRIIWDEKPMEAIQSLSASSKAQLQKFSQRQKSSGANDSLWPSAIDYLCRMSVALRDPMRRVVDTFLPRIADTLKTLKSQQGVFEYDDLLAEIHAALTSEAGDRFLTMIQSRYRFGLIDEFQDTDARQWDIFRRVFAENEHGTLFIIGDPKQAIYGFRGADVGTYLRARRTLIEDERSPAQRLSLDINFRSSPAMIDGVNQILMSNAANALLQGAIRYTDPVSAGKPLGRLRQSSRDEPPITLWRHTPTRRSRQSLLSGWALMDVYLEALTTSLSELLDGSRPLTVSGFGEAPRRITGRDVYVLVRSRREANLVSTALMEAGISCVRPQEASPLQSQEAQEICDVFAAIARPNHLPSRLRAYTTRFFEVPWSALETYQGEGRPEADRLVAWQRLADEFRFGELFRELLYGSGLVARTQFELGGDQTLSRYEQLFDWLLEVLAAKRVDIEGLQNILVDGLSGTSPEGLPPLDSFRLLDGADAVQVMTMHKSKGLEAAVVCVFGGFLKPWDSPVTTVELEGTRHVLIGDEAKGEFEKERLLAARDEDDRLLYVALTRAGAKLFLPIVTSEKSIPGPYSRLNQRLVSMHQSGLDPALFEVIETGKTVLAEDSADPEELTACANLSDALSLMERVPDRSEYKRLRYSHAPWLVTSYSGMKGLEDQNMGQKARSIVHQTIRPNDDEVLPGGRHMGRCLHEILEHLDYSLVMRHAKRDWASIPELSTVFRAAMRRYSVDERWESTIHTMIRDALLSRIATPSLGHFPPLASLQGRREMEFIFPMPERGHPQLGEALDGRQWRVERGLIKGFIDFLFEYEGRTYWVDWKSDQMSRYDSENLSLHVQTHYALQARLYDLALVRLLGIQTKRQFDARFGGSLYVFLRGVTGVDSSDSAGVVFSRTTWHEILADERALLDDPRLPTRRTE